MSAPCERAENQTENASQISVASYEQSLPEADYLCQKVPTRAPLRPSNYLSVHAQRWLVLLLHSTRLIFNAASPSGRTGPPGGRPLRPRKGRTRTRWTGEGTRPCSVYPSLGLWHRCCPPPIHSGCTHGECKMIVGDLVDFYQVLCMSNGLLSGLLPFAYFVALSDYSGIQGKLRNCFKTRLFRGNVGFDKCQDSCLLSCAAVLCRQGDEPKAICWQILVNTSGKA